MTDTLQRPEPFTGPPLSPVDADPSTLSRRRGRRRKRRDIQGLRAIAVLAVVVNHLTGHPQGAFVGVDIFFVISGFLITGILVRDVDRGTGPIRYISNFYRRRIRRILPAALIVLAATIALSYAAFPPGRFRSTWQDGLWAAIFWANWHFISVQTDYFNQGEPPSPFQHYWSLSVEEQFYIVWPILLFAVAFVTLLIVRRHSPLARRMAGLTAALAVSAASLVYAFSQTTANPTGAYFSTFTRAWELGLGAALACVVPYLRAPRAVLTLMSWVGVIAIVVSLFVVNGGHDFPAPAALLPCLGTGLALAAVSGRQRALNPVLTNRVSGFLGDISYSVYLVHFPVIVLLAVYLPDAGGFYYVSAVLLMFGLSVAMYTLVERPVLNSRWLMRGQREHAAAAEDPLPARSGALVGLAAVVIGLLVLALWPGDLARQNQRYEQLVSGLSKTPAHPAGDTSLTPVGGLSRGEQRLSDRIDTALEATTFPTLDPSFDFVLDHDHDSSCAGLDKTTCRTNAATKKLLFVTGDSLADRLFITANAGLRDDYRVVDEGKGSCPPMPVAVTYASPGLRSGCLSHRVQLMNAVKRQRPDSLLLVDNYLDDERIQGTSDRVGAWRESLTTFVKQLKPYVKHIVIVAPDPPTTNPSDCAVRSGASPIDCVSQPPTLFFQLFGLEQAFAKSEHIGYVNTFRWYCSATSECPVFVGTTPMKFDEIHLTTPYAAQLGPLLAARLRPLLGAGAPARRTGH